MITLITKTIRVADLNNEQAKQLQSALNRLNYPLVVDGIVGNATLTAFAKFKKDNWLSQPDLIGIATVQLINEKLSESNFRFLINPVKVGDRDFIVSIPTNWQQKALNKIDFERLADEFNVPIPAVKAVMEVESNGSGFLIREPSPARPKILFEGHIFFKETAKPVSQTRPDLSYRSWTKKFYKGGSAEWNRLIDAMKFDVIPALRSASWGLGQVMGFNHQACGCATVEQFVIEAHKDEYHQARHMFKFCETNNLLPFLRRREWANFASRYNGPAFKQNNYDVKLANAFRKWSS